MKRMLLGPRFKLGYFVVVAVSVVFALTARTGTATAVATFLLILLIVVSICMNIVDVRAHRKPKEYLALRHEILPLLEDVLKANAVGYVVDERTRLNVSAKGRTPFGFLFERLHIVTIDDSEQWLNNSTDVIVHTYAFSRLMKSVQRQVAVLPIRDGKAVAPERNGWKEFKQLYKVAQINPELLDADEADLRMIKTHLLAVPTYEVITREEAE